MRLCVQTAVRKRRLKRSLFFSSSAQVYQRCRRIVAWCLAGVYRIVAGYGRSPPHHMLHLLFASSGAFLAPLPARHGLSAPLRSERLLSTSPQLPNRAAASVPARRVRLSSVRLSSAPIGTELVDYLFFIPFALILFALGAGARSVLMGDDGLFSQVTCDLTRGLTLTLTPTLSPALTLTATPTLTLPR